MYVFSESWRFMKAKMFHSGLDLSKYLILTFTGYKYFFLSMLDDISKIQKRIQRRTRLLGCTKTETLETSRRKTI